MRGAWVVFKKEVIDNLRDRRALRLALVMPILAPALTCAALVFGAREELKAWKEPIAIPVIGAENAPDLLAFLAAHGIEKKPPVSDPEALVKSGDEDIVLVVPPGFGAAVHAGDPALVELVVDEGKHKSERARRRVKGVIDNYAATLGSVRLLARGVDPAVLQPIAVSVRDQSTKEARIAFLLAGLPMFFVLAVFVSGLYVAIDVTAGERERGSLEALLLNPVSRSAFALGKLGAVTVYAWLGLLCTVIGFAVFPRLLPQDIGDLPLRLDVTTLGCMWLALLPLGLLASSLQVLIGTMAKGFREAQATLSYISLVPMLPGMLVAFSAPEPSVATMFVPVLGEQLLMNAWLKGASVPPGLVAITMITTSTLALAMSWLTMRRFDSDSLI